MAWIFNDKTPIYLQAAAHIRSDIVCGQYKMRQKLPSVREMAMLASINPNTMQKAFSLLEEEGLVVTEGTAGRYVTGEDDAVRGAREAMAASIAREYAAQITRLGYTWEEAAALAASYCKQETNSNHMEVYCDESADS